MKGQFSRLHDANRKGPLVLCEANSRWRKLLGLLLVAVAAFMFSVVTLCVKTSISDGMLFGGALLFKSVLVLVINFIVGFSKRLSLRRMFGPKSKIPLLVFLGGFGGFAQLTAFYAVSVLSMGDANVYLMTSPVFVFILARVWLGDPVDWVDIIAAVVCIAGVFFVSKPSAIFGCDTTDDCSLTQYCSLDGICSECSAIEDSEKHDIQGILAADDNFTAFEICSGVQKLTNTTLVNTSSSGSSSSSSSTQSQIVGPTYCQVDESTAASSTSATSYATSDLSVALVYPDHDDSCLFHCLHDYADCTYFTAGIVDGTAICLLYLVDSCGNATNSPSEAILQLGNVAFSSLDTDPPILFRVLGENREEDTSAEGLAIGLAIFSAASVAVTYCIIRKIGRAVDGIVAVNYHSLISTVIGGAVCAWQGLPLPLHQEVWMAVAGLGLAGFVAQWSLTIGFQLEKPGPASVIRYCDVIFVFIWDAVFFNVVPGWNSYVGALLVILSAIGIVLNKGRKEKLGVLQQAPLLKFGDCACCCGPDDLDGADGEVSHAHNARHHRDHRGGHIRGEARRQLELRRKLRAAVNAHSAGIHMLTFGRGHADGNATEKSPPLRAVVEGREDSTSSDFSSERESPSLLVL